MKTCTKCKEYKSDAEFLSRQRLISQYLPADALYASPKKCLNNRTKYAIIAEGNV